MAKAKQIMDIEQQLARIAVERDIHYSLDHITAAAMDLGSPQDSLKFIHIAGTNGKGTTADYIAQYLEGSGYRVGVYASPHLISYTERFCINGQPISDTQLATLFQQITPVADRYQLTEFEILSLIALAYFKKEQVDYVVWETGLGGRLDATNIVTPVQTVITTIAMDHMAYLGNTLADIAREKAGILKRGIPLVMFEQPAEAQQVITHLAVTLDVPVTLVAATGGDYLQQNQLLASEAVRVLTGRRVAGSGRLKPRIKARLQIIRQNPLFLLDGSHNRQGIQQLIAYLGKTGLTTHNSRLTIIYGATRRPDIADIVGDLCAITQRIYLCEFDHPRAVTKAEYQSLELGKNPSQIYYVEKHNVNALLKHAWEQPLRDVCITGSLYFAGAALNWLGSSRSKP